MLPRSSTSIHALLPETESRNAVKTRRARHRVGADDRAVAHKKDLRAFDRPAGWRWVAGVRLEEVTLLDTGAASARDNEVLHGRSAHPAVDAFLVARTTSPRARGKRRRSTGPRAPRADAPGADASGADAAHARHARTACAAATRDIDARVRDALLSDTAIGGGEAVDAAGGRKVASARRAIAVRRARRGRPCGAPRCSGHSAGPSGGRTTGAGRRTRRSCGRSAARVGGSAESGAVCAAAPDSKEGDENGGHAPSDRHWRISYQSTSVKATAEARTSTPAPR